MPAILQTGTRFKYEKHPIEQTITKIYAFCQNGTWGTRITTNNGADTSLEEFIHDIEQGHNISGKITILDADYVAKRLHELFTNNPWYVTIGVSSDNQIIYLYVTDPEQVTENSCPYWKKNDLLHEQYLYDDGHYAIRVHVTRMGKPQPAGD